MTFANKYTEQHYILSDDHRKQVVLSDTREPRKYIANNTKHQRVIVYKVDGGRRIPEYVNAMFLENNKGYLREKAYFYVETASKFGIPCFVWDNGESFRLFNRETMYREYGFYIQAIVRASELYE